MCFFRLTRSILLVGSLVPSPHAKKNRGSTNEGVVVLARKRRKNDKPLPPILEFSPASVAELLSRRRWTTTTTRGDKR